MAFTLCGLYGACLEIMWPHRTSGKLVKLGVNWGWLASSVAIPLPLRHGKHKAHSFIKTQPNKRCKPKLYLTTTSCIFFSILKLFLRL